MLEEEFDKNWKSSVKLWIENEKLHDKFNYGDIVLYNGVKVKYLGGSGNKALIRSAGYQRYVNINKLNRI